ncbi:helix-turn-helix transcriptional regulator [Emergencia sp. JLR.KK010]|uniref:helix-turn-helix domain-containing protein n=1 Tax=Emergencia sp. JLR.KK010 TaxID=3114296 RepID=UPI0030CBA0CC
MEIGSKIAQARKEMNLTQEQLAERMQVTRQTVSRWESQTVYPEMEKIVMLSEILGVSCDYLLHDNMEADAGRSSRKTVSKPVVTRLLREAAGKPIKITFTDEDVDFDINSKTCRILDFDGSWAYVEYQNGKKTETKLIQIASIASIKFEREDK